jgi:hypothetical protein
MGFIMYGWFLYLCMHLHVMINKAREGEQERERVCVCERERERERRYQIQLLLRQENQIRNKFLARVRFEPAIYDCKDKRSRETTRWKHVHRERDMWESNPNTFSARVGLKPVTPDKEGERAKRITSGADNSIARPQSSHLDLSDTMHGYKAGQ